MEVSSRCSEDDWSPAPSDFRNSMFALENPDQVDQESRGDDDDDEIPQDQQQEEEGEANTPLEAFEEEVPSAATIPKKKSAGFLQNTIGRRFTSSSKTSYQEKSGRLNRETSSCSNTTTGNNNNNASVENVSSFQAPVVASVPPPPQVLLAPSQATQQGVSATPMMMMPNQVIYAQNPSLVMQPSFTASEESASTSPSMKRGSTSKGKEKSSTDATTAPRAGSQGFMHKFPFFAKNRSSNDSCPSPQVALPNSELQEVEDAESTQQTEPQDQQLLYYQPQSIQQTPTPGLMIPQRSTASSAGHVDFIPNESGSPVRSNSPDAFGGKKKKENKDKFQMGEELEHIYSQKSVASTRGSTGPIRSSHPFIFSDSSNGNFRHLRGSNVFTSKKGRSASKVKLEIVTLLEPRDPEYDLNRGANQSVSAGTLFTGAGAPSSSSTALSAAASSLQAHEENDFPTPMDSTNSRSFMFNRDSFTFRNLSHSYSSTGFQTYPSGSTDSITGYDYGDFDQDLKGSADTPLNAETQETQKKKKNESTQFTSPSVAQGSGLDEALMIATMDAPLSGDDEVEKELPVNNSSAAFADDPAMKDSGTHKKSSISSSLPQTPSVKLNKVEDPQIEEHLQRQFSKIDAMVKAEQEGEDGEDDATFDLESSESGFADAFGYGDYDDGDNIADHENDDEFVDYGDGWESANRTTIGTATDDQNSARRNAKHRMRESWDVPQILQGEALDGPDIKQSSKGKRSAENEKETLSNASDEDENAGLHRSHRRTVSGYLKGKKLKPDLAVPPKQEKPDAVAAAVVPVKSQAAAILAAAAPLSPLVPVRRTPLLPKQQQPQQQQSPKVIPKKAMKSSDARFVRQESDEDGSDPDDDYGDDSRKSETSEGSDLDYERRSWVEYTSKQPSSFCSQITLGESGGYVMVGIPHPRQTSSSGRGTPQFGEIRRIGKPFNTPDVKHSKKPSSMALGNHHHNEKSQSPKRVLESVTLEKEAERKLSIRIGKRTPLTSQRLQAGRNTPDLGAGAAKRSYSPGPFLVSSPAGTGVRGSYEIPVLRKLSTPLHCNSWSNKNDGSMMLTDNGNRRASSRTESSKPESGVQQPFTLPQWNHNSGGEAGKRRDTRDLTLSGLNSDEIQGAFGISPVAALPKGRNQRSKESPRVSQGRACTPPPFVDGFRALKHPDDGSARRAASLTFASATGADFEEISNGSQDPHSHKRNTSANQTDGKAMKMSAESSKAGQTGKQSPNSDRGKNTRMMKATAPSLPPPAGRHNNNNSRSNSKGDTRSGSHDGHFVQQPNVQEPVTTHLEEQQRALCLKARDSFLSGTKGSEDLDEEERSLTSIPLDPFAPPPPSAFTNVDANQASPPRGFQGLVGSSTRQPRQHRNYDQYAEEDTDTIRVTSDSVPATSVNPNVYRPWKTPSTVPSNFPSARNHTSASTGIDGAHETGRENSSSNDEGDSNEPLDGIVLENEEETNHNNNNTSTTDTSMYASALPHDSSVARGSVVRAPWVSGRTAVAQGRPVSALPSGLDSLSGRVSPALNDRAYDSIPVRNRFNLEVSPMRQWALENEAHVGADHGRGEAATAAAEWSVGQDGFFDVDDFHRAGVLHRTEFRNSTTEEEGEENDDDITTATLTLTGAQHIRTGTATYSIPETSKEERRRSGGPAAPAPRAPEGLNGKRSLSGKTISRHASDVDFPPFHSTNPTTGGGALSLTEENQRGSSYYKHRPENDRIVEEAREKCSTSAHSTKNNTNTSVTNSNNVEFTPKRNTSISASATTGLTQRTLSGNNASRTVSKPSSVPTSNAVSVQQVTLSRGENGVRCAQLSATEVSMPDRKQSSGAQSRSSSKASSIGSNAIVVACKKGFSQPGKQQQQQQKRSNPASPISGGSTVAPATAFMTYTKQQEYDASAIQDSVTLARRRGSMKTSATSSGSVRERTVDPMISSHPAAPQQQHQPQQQPQRKLSHSENQNRNHQQQQNSFNNQIPATTTQAPKYGQLIPVNGSWYVPMGPVNNERGSGRRNSSNGGGETDTYTPQILLPAGMSPQLAITYLKQHVRSSSHSSTKNTEDATSSDDDDDYEDGNTHDTGAYRHPAGRTR